MTGAASPAIWHEPTPLRVLGTGAALPGEPIMTEELLTAVDRRFALSLRRPGLAIAHKLGIRTRHLCRDMTRRLEAPRKGHRNPELAAAAVRAALSEAGVAARDLSYLIGHTATPAHLMPPNIGQAAELLDFHGPFVEFRQACTGFAWCSRMDCCAGELGRWRSLGPKRTRCFLTRTGGGGCRSADQSRPDGRRGGRDHPRVR